MLPKIAGVFVGSSCVSAVVVLMMVTVTSDGCGVFSGLALVIQRRQQPHNNNNTNNDNSNARTGIAEGKEFAGRYDIRAVADADRKGAVHPLKLVRKP